MRPVYWAIAIFILVYLALDLNKLYALRYGADFGTFLQTISNMRHGSSWNYAEWHPHLLVHDSWALFALAPLIALFPQAETLIVVQVCVVAAAAIPLVLFARDIGASPKAANLLGITYLLTPSAQGFTYDNFSENVFVPFVIFSTALAVRRRLFVLALLGAQVLMGLKEDEILFVAWFAVACSLFWDRRLGIAALSLAVINGLTFWSIEQYLGSRPISPAYAFSIEDASGRFTLVALLLAPFAFAPVLVGRWLLLAAPLLAEIMFAQKYSYEPSRIGSHYTAPLLACTAIAAAFGIRSRPELARWMVPCAVFVILFVFNDTALRPGRWPFIVDWHAYEQAVAVRETRVPILLRRHDEGVWAVAAVNPLVRLDPHNDPQWVACPAYNTNAVAFFSSLRFNPKAKWKLCGGVPMSSY